MKEIFNNSINIKNLNEEIEIYGWVSKVRNLGGLIFVDLRDRSGIIQLVINPEKKLVVKYVKEIMLILQLLLVR